MFELRLINLAIVTFVHFAENSVQVCQSHVVVNMAKLKELQEELSEVMSIKRACMFRIKLVELVIDILMHFLGVFSEQFHVGNDCS